VSISRPVTIAGWIIIAVVFVTAWIVARVSDGRFPTAVALIRTGMRHLPVRIIALAAWAWVGWHFFVHTSR
jgi:hypothetical protein